MFEGRETGNPPAPPAAPPAAPVGSDTQPSPGADTTPAAPHFTTPNADIATILGSDPNYQQLLAFDKAASGEDLAMMNARISKMTSYYGSDADPLSILGRIAQAKQDRDRYIANTLAGHGMFFSGETGFQGERSRLDYMRAELDAKTKLQEYIDGLNQAFAYAERNRKFQELQAAWTATNNWLMLNQPTIDPTTGAPVAGPQAGPVGSPGDPMLGQ